MKLHFQSKVIKFINEFIYNYDIEMIRDNKQARKVSPNETRVLYNSILLCQILNISACAPFWDMVCRKVKYVSKKTEMHQFQVVCMSYPTLKQNKAFNEKN